MGFWTAAAWVSLYVSRHDKTRPSNRLHAFNNDNNSIEYSCSTCLSRSDAAQLLDQSLLPKALFGARLGVSGASNENPKVMLINDPSLELAYGEFPFVSLDALVDVALMESNYAANEITQRPSNKLSFLDLGSGAGRLCLYATMTRPGWKVCGIEIVPALHELARQASQGACDQGVFSTDAATVSSSNHGSKIQFLLGSAQEYITILKQADIIFCYSTVWDTAGFSVESGAMVLSSAWMELLRHCRPGSIVITTDRCLDLSHGWTLLERMEVENREVMGSVGYVHCRT
jgi:SAM-dependent methyltransferase